MLTIRKLIKELTNKENKQQQQQQQPDITNTSVLDLFQTPVLFPSGNKTTFSPQSQLTFPFTTPSSISTQPTFPLMNTLLPTDQTPISLIHNTMNYPNVSQL